MGWIDEAASVDLADVFVHLGIESYRGGSAGPCPACGAERRGSSDRRGAMNVREKGARLVWHCKRCDVGGDGLDAVALSIASRRFPDLEREDRGRVRAWYADRRWCEAADDYRPAPTVPAPKPVRRREEDDDRGQLEPPPAEEVAAFWKACRLVDESEPAICDYLESREFDAGRVAELGFPRVAPAETPSWWPAAWSDEFRLVWPAFDAQGRLRSVHGRRVPRYQETEGGIIPVCEGECGGPLRRDLEPGPAPYGERCWICGWKPRRKTTWPAGFGAGGMLFADRGGVLLLAGRPKHSRVLVVEGVTDLLRAAMLAPDVPCAVLGFTSGGARALADVRWPAGVQIAIATDNDAAGDKYADEAAEAVSPIIPRRVRWADL